MNPWRKGPGLSLLRKLAVIMTVLGLFASSAMAEDTACFAIFQSPDIHIPPFQATANLDIAEFLSTETNQFHLFLENHELIEVKDIPVRNQCYGTCYLYAGQTNLQVALKNSGALPSDGYLINFVPVMKMAWERHRDRRINERPLFNLERLVTSGGLGDYYRTMIGQPLYFFDGADVTNMGGYTRLSRWEARLIDAINESTSVFWKPVSTSLQRRMQYIIGDEYPEYLTQMTGLMQSRLSLAVSLRPFIIKDLQVQYYEKVGMFLVSYTGKASNYRSYQSDIFLRDYKRHAPQVFNEKNNYPEMSLVGSISGDILPRIIDSLNQGKTVDVVISKIFSASGADVNHAITLTGLVIDKTTHELKGFKYINSWGKAGGYEGFGFISRNLFEQYFKSAQFIESVELFKPL